MEIKILLECCWEMAIRNVDVTADKNLSVSKYEACKMSVCQLLEVAKSVPSASEIKKC